MASYDASIKIMLLGDESVEKTSLTIRYISGFFLEDLKLTIGVDFYSKIINIDNKKIKLQIWDFGGEERFRFLLHQYCKGANGAFFLYDITNRLSLDHLPDWTQIIREHAGDIPIILLGAKAHLKEFRAVTKDEGILAVKKYNLSGFIEVSSKTGQNVEKAFEALTRLVLIQPVFCQKCKKEFTFEEFIKHPCYKAGEVLSTGRPSSYIPQTQGSYVPQTNISKKEKKKLAKEKKCEQKERAKPERIKKIVENREKQEKLIEDMKKSKKIKKEKQFEPFIPFTGRSKTKEESKSKLRIIPNVEEVEADSNTFATKIAPEFGATSKKSTVDKRRFQELFEKLFEEHEGIRGFIICDSSGLPIDSNMDIEISEEISAYVTSLIGKAKQLVQFLKEGGLKFIRLETSKGEVMIALEEQLILIIFMGEKGEKHVRYRNGGDSIPYPYIFTHPRPPDDFAGAAQVQVRAPLKNKDPEEEIYCQYCGRKLTKEEQFTHSCKKKPK